MKLLRSILIVLASSLFAQSIYAVILRSSQIVNFNTGNLGADITTGQIDQWFLVGNAGTITLTNGSGSLDGAGLGLVASAGDRIFIGAADQVNASRNQFAPNATFPQGNETNLYFSFLYRFRNAADVSADGEVMIRVNRANSGTGTAQHWDLLARNVGGQIQLGISKAGAPNNATNYATTNLSAGQTVFVVVRQHIIPGAQNDLYDLWINPPPAFFGTNEVDIPLPDSSIGALATDGTEDSSGTGPGRFVIGSGLNAEFDEFRVATTWAEATPWFGQCLSAGVGALTPTNLTQSAEISATFRVAPLGTSPTLQWQRSTDTGSTWNDIPGAMASLYTTPNLTLAESGVRYRVIVNVACNSSSATSAVATVTLTNPVVTPVGMVMNDTFLDPDLGFESRNNPPLSATNSLWYTATDESVPGLVAFGQGGNLVGTPNPGASSLWLGYFTDTNKPPVHLDVGRAIKVTLPFTPNSFGTFTNNSGLRIGLFDYYDGATRITQDGPAAGGSRGNGIGVRGYMLNLDFGQTFTANTPLQLLARSLLQDDNLMGSIGDYQSLGSGPAGGGYTGAPAFLAGTQYTLEFLVARPAVNTINVTATITGGGTNWSHTITDNAYAYHRFDAFGLRPNSLETSADSFTFSEFLVEVVQSAVALLPFNITRIETLSPGSVKLTWDSVSGATYRVLSRNTITALETTNATIVATGSSTSYTNSPVSGAERYYRVVATPAGP
jgi:hypothetical protein